MVIEGMRQQSFKQNSLENIQTFALLVLPYPIYPAYPVNFFVKDDTLCAFVSLR